jgi:hypothetical protein
LWTNTFLSIRSCENRLQSFKNSFIVDLLLMNFLTRSKNAISSDVAPEVEVGVKGSGTRGVKVGSGAWVSEVLVRVIPIFCL